MNYNVAGFGANPADANDFGGGLPFGQVIFGIGDTSKTITIPVTGDTLVEPDETFAVTLSNPTPNTVQINQNVATGTILNDDSSLSISATDANKLEGNTGSTTPFLFTVTRRATRAARLPSGIR